MSLAVPTPHEYRTALDRLQGEHARRVLAEQEVTRLRDQNARRRPDGATWTHTMTDAAAILQTMPKERPEMTDARRMALEVNP